MSGLAGIFDFSGTFRENTPLWVSCARRMLARISHRGHNILRECITEHGVLLQGDTANPEQKRDESVFCYEHCAVILDGHLTQKDALCRVLRRNGIPCCSHDPDCMLILLTYLSFKAEMRLYLHGSFSFVLYDALKQKVLLCRDSLGVKPLYFTVTQNRLLFASEIKGLLEHPDVFPEVGTAGLCTLLLRAPYTAGQPLFCCIRELPPGACASFDRNGFSEEQFLLDSAFCTLSYEKSDSHCIETNIDRSGYPCSADLQADWTPALLARDIPGTALEDAVLLHKRPSGRSVQDILRTGCFLPGTPDKAMYFTREILAETIRPEIAERLRPFIQTPGEAEPTRFAARALLLERLDRYLVQSAQELPPSAEDQLVHAALRMKAIPQRSLPKELCSAIREKLRVILSDHAQPLHFLFSADAVQRKLESNRNLRLESYLIELNLWMNRYAVRIRP